LHDIIEKQEPRGAKVFHNISMLDMILNMKSSLHVLRVSSGLVAA